MPVMTARLLIRMFFRPPPIVPGRMDRFYRERPAKKTGFAPFFGHCGLKIRKAADFAANVEWRWPAFNEQFFGKPMEPMWSTFVERVVAAVVPSPPKVTN